ncbi:MAG: 5-formyltetrahydrofolate cyclo-ligase [Campylobacterales bacterium]|nr:5-formyltetrahydrofolate cyclo-ligase [Campylobacterales bacterium]
MSLSKKSFRSECLERMKKAPRNNKRAKDARLRGRLEKVLKGLHVKRILLYWPLPFEADLRPLIVRLRRRVGVYLPFMEGESFKMVAFRLPLERKAFGIYEPRNSYRTIKNIDVAIVPAVGVDGRARRIGFGKGMYDRFFAGLSKQPIIIFVQPELCLTPKNICDHYDVSADLLVTPWRCYGARGTKNVKRDVIRRRRCHH